MVKKILFSVSLVVFLTANSIIGMQSLIEHDKYWGGLGGGQGQWFMDIANTRGKLVAAAYEDPCRTLAMFQRYRSLHTQLWSSVNIISNGIRATGPEGTWFAQGRAGDGITAAIMSAVSARIANPITEAVLKAMCYDADFINTVRGSGAFSELVKDLIYWGDQTDDPARRQMLKNNLWNESQTNYNKIKALYPGL